MLSLCVELKSYKFDDQFLICHDGMVSSLKSLSEGEAFWESVMDWSDVGLGLRSESGSGHHG